MTPREGAGGSRGGKRTPAGRPGRTPGKNAGGPGSAARGRKPPTGRETPPDPVKAPTRDVHDPEGIRLQKVLAGAGMGSRRACEVLIEAGRVEVDGQIVRELGVRIDPKSAIVHVDGLRLQLDESMIYIAFNKPLGVVSTMGDPEGRPNLSDYVEDRPERLFHVGRLDVDTEGLILLTNDGDLSHRLSHPSFGVSKTYLVEIPGPLPRGIGRRLREGVELADGVASVDDFKVVDSQPGKVLVQIVLHEGRNRIVRRMMDEVGHPVLQLVRTQVGPIRLGDLRSGRYRVLNRVEVGSLLGEVGR